MRAGFGSSVVSVTALALSGLAAAGCEGRTGPSADPPVDDSVPFEVWFEEVALERGIDFRHRSGHTERFLMPESVSGGGGLFDADGDGDLDVYLVQSGSLTDAAARRPGNQLFENLGDGTFRNISRGSGAEDAGYGMGVACGDFDNDADVDLYVTNVGPNTLLRNEGGGRFTDVGAEAGVAHDGYGSSSGFIDYDRDGDLDLFVVNYIHWSEDTELACRNRMRGDDYCGPASYRSPAADVLYRNNGDGTFTDVSEASGIGADFGNGLGVVFGDFNGDGWPDAFVANDALPDQLWINRGDGTFVDRAAEAGCAVDHERGFAKAGMGTAAADLDNDGDLDLMVCNFAGETDSILLNEDGLFTDVTARSGLAVVSPGFTRFGAGWADFDNDGYLDLYQANGRIRRELARYADDLYAEPNLLFRGGPGPRFTEVRPRGGTAEPLSATSRAAAFGDFDDDGGLDVLVVNRDERAHLLRGLVHERGRWIGFRVLDGHGRDALGARVEVRVGGRSAFRDVRSAYSYLACNDPRVHFGLGRASGVDEVEVRWPDGTTENFGRFSSGQVVTVRRGESTARTRGDGSSYPDR